MHGEMARRMKEGSAHSQVIYTVQPVRVRVSPHNSCAEAGSEVYSQSHIKTNDEADETASEQDERANQVDFDDLPLFLGIVGLHEVRVTPPRFFGVHSFRQAETNDRCVCLAQEWYPDDSGGTSQSNDQNETVLPTHTLSKKPTLAQYFQLAAT